MMGMVRAIEYNTWSSLIKYITEQVVEVKKYYNYGNKEINVYPSYPRDLTKYTKPSIIVQRVGDDRTNYGFIGQYYNVSTAAYQDCGAVEYNIEFQIDVEGDSNIQCELLSGMITDIIAMCKYENNGTFDLYDFIEDPNNPTLVGTCKFAGDESVVTVEYVDRVRGNPLNSDYVRAHRFNIVVMQALIKEDEDMVDLARIKFNQHVVI